MALAQRTRSARSRRACSSLVEPSMSVNRKVTVPLGVGGVAVIVADAAGFSDGACRSGLAQPAGEPAQDGQRHGRVARGRRPRSPSVARARQVVGSAADHLGVARLAVEDGQLPEELARAEVGQRLAVANDADRPDATMKKPVPISPWRAITWSAGTSTSVARSAIGPGLRRRRRRRGGSAASSSVVAFAGEGHRASIVGSMSAHAALRRSRGPSTRAERASSGGADVWHHDGGWSAREDAGRRDRRLHPVRRPDRPAAGGHRPHVRGGVLRRGRARPPPGPLRLRLLRDPRRRGGRRHRRLRAGAASPGATSSARCRSSSASRRSPTSSPSGRCAASSSPGRASKASWSTTRGSCTGCSRPRLAGCGRRTDGGAERARSRRATTRSSSSAAARARSRSRTRSGHLGVDARGDLGRSVARRHVPALAVLPAAPVVDQAARPGRARHAGPTSATTGTACSATSPRPARLQPEFMDGTLVLPVAAGDGGEPRRPSPSGPVSPSATAAAGPARAARTGPDGDRFVVETTRREYRCRDAGRRRRRRRAAHAARPRDGARPPLRRRPPGRDLRGASACSSSASRTPASSWRPASCRGRARSCSRRRRRRDCRSRPASLVGVRARYVQPFEDHVLGGGVSVLDAAIDRIERGAGRELVVHLRRTDGGCRPGHRGRRRDRRDRLRDPAAATCRPSASRRSGRASCRPRRRGGRAPACPGSSSPGRSARAPRGSRSTASRPTRARSTAPATTPGSWPATLPGRASGSSPSGRSSRPMRSPPSWPTSWPRRPSCSTSAATWPAC